MKYARRTGTLEGMMLLLSYDSERAKELWREYLEKYPDAELGRKPGRLSEWQLTIT